MIKFIISMAFLLLSAISFAQTEAKILYSDIRGRSCSGGLGICSSSAENFKNFTLISQDNKTIVLEIDIKTLNQEEQMLLFNTDLYKNQSEEKLFFTQNTDFVFNATQIKNLGLNASNNILKKGTYESKKIGQKVQIILNLVAK
jgi:hypothetical protein